MVQIIQENRKPSGAQLFAESLGNFAQSITQKRMQQDQVKQENDAVKRLTGGDISGIQDPKMREKILELTLTGQRKSFETAEQLKGNRKKIEQLEIDRDLPKGSLSAYENDPAMAERVSRPAKKTQASQPIDSEQMSKIKNVRKMSGYEEADPLTKYQMLTENGVSKENSQAEADIASKQSDLQFKKFDTSYKAQEDFINDITDQHKVYESQTKPRLLQLQKLANDDDLIGPKSAVFLETLGIPLGALEGPSSEVFQKTSLDLLKGLPETFGNRIMKVEVENFLKTIPTLLNSAEGRRMITSNMLKLGEMKEVYYNEMRRQQKESLDESKPLARDFQQRVFDQVKPQIDRINDDFVKLTEIKHVPKGEIPFFDPNGNIVFVPKQHAEWALENGGRRIW